MGMLSEEQKERAVSRGIQRQLNGRSKSAQTEILRDYSLQPLKNDYSSAEQALLRTVGSSGTKITGNLTYNDGSWSIPTDRGTATAKKRTQGDIAAHKYTQYKNAFENQKNNPDSEANKNIAQSLKNFNFKQLQKQMQAAMLQTTGGLSKLMDPSRFNANNRFTTTPKQNNRFNFQVSR